MPLADAARSFQFMHPPHVAAMVLIAAAAAGLCVTARKLERPSVTRTIAWAISVAVLANEMTHWVWALCTSGLAEFLRTSLPLHVCGAGVFISAFVLIRRHQFLYEVLYFWALGGTLQAIVTPDLDSAFPTYQFFRYFVAHGCVVVGAAFATWGLRMRPRPGSVWRVFGFSVAFMAFVGLANYLLRPVEANYMFLCEAAGGASPFFFLPWPWYILFLVAFGLGIMWLLYLPFAIARRRSRPAP